MTSTLRTLWHWLTEPTLIRRSVASVLVAFVVVWAVLLAYNYINFRNAITRDPGLMKYGNAVLESLAPIADPTQAGTALAATDHWTNVRRRQIGLLPGALMHELRDAATGQPVFASPSLQNTPLPAVAPQAPPSIQEAVLQGRSVRVYTGRNERWVLRVFETKRTDASFLQTNGRALLPYLLLAAPLVLLAVWLSVRNGLRPLQQLARRIAQRGQDDLQPVGFHARHRELRPLEQSLDHLFAQLRQKVERERVFVQDAAHEIRTPLAVINAQAHVLARSPDAAERAQAQAHLEQAIARTSHLAQQLLDLAALDDAQRPAPRDLDVAQWLRAALAQAAPAAMAKQIELSLDAPDHLPARLDLPAMESIVHNLVDNAVRYAHAGGSVAVGLCVERPAPGKAVLARLSVQDDGPGIAPAEGNKVFERFYRGVGQDTASGTGLGLAIVRQAVVRVGGEVWLGEGLGGKGAGIFVRIPLGANL
jgi:two-component system sensor histidine kinase QseC